MPVRFDCPPFVKERNPRPVPDARARNVDPSVLVGCKCACRFELCSVGDVGRNEHSLGDAECADV